MSIRCRAIDLADPRGKAIVLKLTERADIVLENFRPGVVKKPSLDYDSLKAVDAGLIHASLPGFGQTGPYGKKGGFDIIAQGMSGIMMMTGCPGGQPAKVGYVTVGASNDKLWNNFCVDVCDRPTLCQHARPARPHR